MASQRHAKGALWLPTLDTVMEEILDGESSLKEQQHIHTRVGEEAVTQVSRADALFGIFCFHLFLLWLLLAAWLNLDHCLG